MENIKFNQQFSRDRKKNKHELCIYGTFQPFRAINENLIKNNRLRDERF